MNYSQRKRRRPRTKSVQFHLSTVQPPTTFGDRLYYLRAQRGLTAKQLARRAGLDATTIHGWENARHAPTLLELARAAKVLETDLQTLLDREQPTWGQRLQMCRLEGGYTQSELGRRMGLTRGRISGWERDRGRPSPIQLRRLEKILGTEFEEE